MRCQESPLQQATNGQSCESQQNHFGRFAAFRKFVGARTHLMAATEILQQQPGSRPEEEVVRGKSWCVKSGVREFKGAQRRISGCSALANQRRAIIQSGLQQVRKPYLLTLLSHQTVLFCMAFQRDLGMLPKQFRESTGWEPRSSEVEIIVV